MLYFTRYKINGITVSTRAEEFGQKYVRSAATSEELAPGPRNLVKNM